MSNTEAFVNEVKLTSRGVNDPLIWNVIDKDGFRNRVRQVFDQVANMLKHTLGPYGSTTIIERMGEMHITKDGWNILKRIHFEDATDNNIMQLLFNISAQVVIKVGDGSTSSIIAANEVLRQIENDEILNKARPSDLMKALNRCVTTINEIILQNATEIKKDSDLLDIYKLAMISTNSNEEISSIIQEIYQRTGNPYIEFVKSKTPKTHLTVTDGYQGNIAYLDSIYATNDEGTCEINNPIILMFDHVVEKGLHYDNIIQPAIQLAIQQNRRLVVISPGYDRLTLQQIKTIANMEYKSQGRTTTVYARVSTPNNNLTEQYFDFAIMTGGTIIRESNVHDFLDEKVNVTVEEFLGAVEKISIGGAIGSTFISGLFNRNKNMFNAAMKDAQAKFHKLEQQHREMNIVNADLYELKKRIAKLKGNMGIIHVGGSSELEKTANLDLVEDAVKACESAFHYGYNIGGNLVIPITIDKILEDNKSINELDERVYMLLSLAFRNTFKKVLENKFTDDDPSIDIIIDSAIGNETCYNLITDEFSSDVINPCFTDIEILKAAASIVGLLVSSNQYISIKTEF